MGMHKDEGVISCSAGEDLAEYRFVKLGTTAVNGLPVVTYADSGDTPIGMSMSTVASGANVGVKLMKAAGTRSVSLAATEAIAIGDSIYLANDGKVASTVTTLMGYAIEAATTADQQFEIIPV